MLEERIQGLIRYHPYLLYKTTIRTICRTIPVFSIPRSGQAGGCSKYASKTADYRNLDIVFETPEGIDHREECKKDPLRDSLRSREFAQLRAYIRTLEKEGISLMSRVLPGIHAPRTKSGGVGP